MNLSEQIASSPERMRAFQQERLALEVTELICELMLEQKVTRAELAARLGKSRPFVTRLLRDGTNMTIHTMADVFWALGCSPRVVERPLSVFSPRLKVVESSSEPTTTLDADADDAQERNGHLDVSSPAHDQ